MAKHPPTRRARQQAQLAPYLEVLGALGLKPRGVAPRGEPPPRGDLRPDARLRLEGPLGVREWAAELRPRLGPGALGPLVHRMHVLRKRERRAILLTKHAPPRLADELRAQNIAFIDAAGNAFLQDEGLFVWVVGRRPEQAPPGARRGLHTAGLKLLFVLLQGAGEHATHRDLAARAGIALGGVGRILRELKLRRWIRTRPVGALELQDVAALLRQWDEGYAHTLRPKLFLRTCRRKPGTDLTALADRIARTGLAGQVRVGGELGAAALTGRLRPARATLHLAGIDAQEVMRRLELLPDRDGDVDLLAAFGAEGAAAGPIDDRARPADPLLLRAELLLHPDDRLTEVAEELRTGHIETRWR